MTAPEFSRIAAAHEIGQRQPVDIEADAGERAALAVRFTMLSLDRLTAALVLSREAAGIRVTGRIAAAGTQPCVVTGEPVPFAIDEPVALLLTDAPPEGDQIELGEADLDVEILDGDSIDLGEIAAQALALALDPWPRAAGATAAVVIDEETARARANPFAVLKGDRA